MKVTSVKQRLYFDPHETHRLRELEGVKLASFKRRAAAMAIDMSFLTSLVILLVLSAVLLREAWVWVNGGPPNDNLSVPVNQYIKMPLVQIAVLLGYFGLSTFFTNGKTLGKFAMRIRVLSTVHEKMNLWHSLERGLGYLASSLEFGFGFMQYFINPNHRCVHDRIAETIVVEEEAIRRLKRIS
jgi:uncharacterized RDD family membrane protein YckC